MKKLNIVSVAAAIAFVGGIAVLPASPALAQKGSRLCGKTAPTPTGAIGILFEVRMDGADYPDGCKTLVDKVSNWIARTPDLASLQWTTRYNKSCEEVGAMFKSGNSDVDMCEPYMTAEQGYQVVKTNSTNSTTYVKVTTSSY